MSVLQKVRLISNERLDLPDFLNIENFACADWGQYFEQFMANTPFIVKGFEILNPSALISSSSTEATIIIADSVMFHPTSSNASGGFFVATPSEDNQTVALTPNSTNFIELDQVAETGAPDTRAVWDPSANGGQGAEYSQIIDTVTFLKTEVSVNTVSFTEGKIPIAKVVVDNSPVPVIISITDCRPMFFRLGSGGNNPDPLNDFVWPSDTDAVFARTEIPVTIDAATIATVLAANPSISAADVNPFRSADKNLINFKDWMDAVMTRIKEITGSPYWYKAGGLVPGLSLSNIWWDAYASTMTGTGLFQHSGGAAVGSLTFGNINIVNQTDTFTLDDGVNSALVFEFTNDGTIEAGSDVAVVIGAGGTTLLNTVDEFKDATIAAINGASPLNIEAFDGGTGVVSLKNTVSGPQGNIVIIETVADAGFTATGMAGGENVGTLTWTSDVFVRSIIGNYFFRIPAGSITLADDEVAYLEQIRNQPLPAGAPLTWVNGKNYVNGALGSFAGLTVGDFIKKESDGVESYVRIADFRDAADGLGNTTPAATALSALLETTVCISASTTTLWQVGDTVTVNGTTCDVVSIPKNVSQDSNDVRLVCDTFTDIDAFAAGAAGPATGAPSGASGTFDRIAGEYAGSSETVASHYAKSEYTLSSAKREAVPTSGDTWWLAFRDDNGSQTARIYIGKTGAELEEGEEIGISDQPPVPLLNYIGTPSQTDETPDYATQAQDTKNSQTNYNAANGENLTVRAAKLTSMMADKSQDKNIEMLFSGVTFLWNLATETLTWDGTLTWQIPSSNDDNTLAANAFTGIVLQAGEVAYVDLDRNNPLALTNVVVAADAVPMGENIFVWARRDGDDVLIGSSFKLRPTDSALAEYTDHLRNERMFKPIITQAAPDTAFSIYPGQRISGNKRKKTFINGLQVSKFPRNGAGAYDGGANDDQLTIVDFDALSTPGSIEVGVTFPSIARSVVFSTATPSVGAFIGIAIQVNSDDSISAVAGSAQASLALALDDDNLPLCAPGSYPVAVAILEVTGATTLANISEDRLVDYRPAAFGTPGEYPTTEFDKHQDALTENTLEEIFINVLQDTNYDDSSESINLTKDVVSRALVGQVNGSSVSYDAKIQTATPDSVSVDPWTVDGDGSLDYIAANRLRINDSTGSDHLFYRRDESSLVDKAVAEMRFNLEIISSGSGTTGCFAALEDDTKIIRVAVIESGSQYLVGFSNADGSTHIGTPTIIDLSVPRDFRILKIGRQTAQLEYDGQLIDVVPWASFSAATDSNGISFGTDNDGALVDCGWGEVNYSVYPNVHATIDIARRTDTISMAFKNASETPDLLTPAWSEGGTASADTTTNPGKLTIADTTAAMHKVYTLAGSDSGLSVDGFKKTLIWDSMFHLSDWTQSQGSLDMVSHVQILNGYKRVNVGITYDGTNSGVVIGDDLNFNAVLSGTVAQILTDVDWTEPGNSLRIEFIGHLDPAQRKVRVLVNRDVRLEVLWDELNDDTSNPGEMQFGTGTAAAQDFIGTTQWDLIEISKPGEAPPIELPVLGFLGTLTSNDDNAIICYSSDNGNTWTSGRSGEVAGLDYTRLAVGGGEIKVLIGLSQAGSFIDDYSIMYSQEKATGGGFFRYYEFEAVGGETLVNLPFSYSLGNNELEVIENGLELFAGITRDYTETSPTSITLNTAADPGDLYKIRVNHRVIVDEGHLDGGPNKHKALQIDVEGTYSQIAGTPTDLETALAAIDTALLAGASGGGSGRREIWQIAGGTNPPSSGIFGASLGVAAGLSFDASINEDIIFQVPIPDNADITDDFKIVIKYVMDADNAGDVKLDLDYVVADLADDVDPGTYDVSTTTTFTPGSGADLHRKVEITIPAAQVPSVDAMLLGRLTRDAVDGGDTHTGEFKLMSLEISYTTV